MTWNQFGSREVYGSPWVSVDLVDVGLPDGTRIDHHAVRMPRPAAGVVVVNEAGKDVLMFWRHRFIPGTWGWEVPAGRIEEGEEPSAGAAREVLEETGWRAGPLEPLIDFHPASGLSDLHFWIWTAYGAELVGEPTECNEAARVAWVPLAAIRDLIEAGELTDGLSLTAILAYLALRRPPPAA